MKKIWCGILVFISAAFFGAFATAEPDLVIRSPATEDVKSLTLEEIQSMEQMDILTSNEFVDGVRKFTGPLMRSLLADCGAGEASQIRLIAANDYQVEINVDEFFTYDVILAHSIDDQALSRRGKGPLWLIYPMSDHSELSDPVYNSRLIWQVVRIEYW